MRVEHCEACYRTFARGLRRFLTSCRSRDKRPVRHASRMAHMLLRVNGRLFRRSLHRAALFCDRVRAAYSSGGKSCSERLAMPHVCVRGISSRLAILGEAIRRHPLAGWHAGAMRADAATAPGLLRQSYTLRRQDVCVFPLALVPACKTHRRRARLLGAARAAAFAHSYLVDPASSHMLVSKIKPCMSKYKQFIQ